MLDDMAQEIGVLGTPNSDISAVNAEVIRLQDEAAQKPDHWLHDGLKSHFEEIQQQLSDLKRQDYVVKLIKTVKQRSNIKRGT